MHDFDAVTIYKKRTKWAWLSAAGSQDGYDSAREALDAWIKATDNRAVPIYLERDV